MRAHQGEFGQIQADGVGAGALAYDDVDGKVLHGGVENLFYNPVQTVNFVDEQNVTGIQIGQQRRQVAGLFDGRAGGDADIHTHLVGDDTCQGGLAQAGRAVKQSVIQRLATQAGSLDVNRQIALGLLLAGIVGKELGAQANLPRVLGREGGRDDGAVQFLGKS